MSLRKCTIIIVCLSILIVILAVWFFWTNSSEWNYVTKELTQQQAIKEMPYIAISDEDFLLVQTICQDDDIKEALKEGQITDHIIKKGNELAREMLPEDIEPGTVYSGDVFSAGVNTINIDYSYNGHRVIIDLRENGTITKVVSRYPKNGLAKDIYINIDNKEYERHRPVPQWWFNIVEN